MLLRIGLGVVMLSLSAAASCDPAEDKTRPSTTNEQATEEIVVTASKVEQDSTADGDHVKTHEAVQDAVLIDLAGRLSRDTGHRETFWYD
jgi:hypothetical protein